jgi:hypothetical protein
VKFHFMNMTKICSFCSFCAEIWVLHAGIIQSRYMLKYFSPCA